MNKEVNCIFTICATNYVGLAKALEASVLKYTTNVTFMIIVADEPSPQISKSFSDNILVAKNILPYKREKWHEMAFKYNLTEFCTSIKPYAFNYFFDYGYEKVIYLDPDILTFSSMSIVLDYLNNYSAVVTPHILTPEVNFSGNLEELHLLFSGVYNFGFLALKNTPRSREFTNWWGKRLEDYCFGDQLMNLFTDQKWGDLLPCFMGTEALVSENMGLNLAPWNFHERKLLEEDGCYYVKSRVCESEKKEKLVFVHYSGYNYKLMMTGDIVNNNLKNIKQYLDLLPLFDAYSNCLKAVDVDTFINERYTYNYFENSDWYISDQYRKLYRGYIECGNPNTENPFSIESTIFVKAKKSGYLQKEKPQLFVFDRKSVSVQNKANIINNIMKLIFRIIGPSKYYMLTRLMRRYSIWENHAFLITGPNENYKLK